MNKLKSNLMFFIYTVLLGSVVGGLIWSFLKVMSLGAQLLWEYLPSQISIPFYTIIVCAAGGLITGLWKRRFGDYPEELSQVLGAVKKTGRYPYNNVFSTMISALLPLVIGASVGPEAGLTGIISGLCTWVGDKLRRFHHEIDELTAIGLSATLGTIFRSPMFGFVEPLESERQPSLPRTSKMVLYFTAILSSFGTFILLNHLTGGKAGMEAQPAEALSPVLFLYAAPLILAGVLAGYLFYIFKKLTSVYRRFLRKLIILRAVIGGLLLGIAGTFLPLTMFSGEHQMEEVFAGMKAIGALTLLLVAVVKLLLTNVCIDSGLKGGHFFPVIFSGICIGCSLSILFGISAVFCAAMVTTALVAHTLKKPLATVLLLMIVFPPVYIPFMLAAAFISVMIPTARPLLPEE